MRGRTRSGAQHRRWLLPVLVPAALLGAVAAVVVVLAAGAPGNTGSAAGPAAGSGGDTVATSFGVLEVGAVTWSRGDTAGQQGGGHSEHSGHGGRDEGGPSTVVAHRHQVWNGEVRVDVTVENSSDQPVLFSPGQLRLSLQGSGPTVAPLDAGRPPGPVNPGTSVRTWVSYRVPAHTEDPWLEFRDVTPRPPALLPLETDHGRAPEGGHQHD